MSMPSLDHEFEVADCTTKTHSDNSCVISSCEESNFGVGFGTLFIIFNTVLNTFLKTR